MRGCRAPSGVAISYAEIPWFGRSEPVVCAGTKNTSFDPEASKRTYHRREPTAGLFSSIGISLSKLRGAK